MTDDLYERYKEALRNGHVAVLRGDLAEALSAYRLAAEIAPSRAMPHTSMGGVHMRMGHLEDALTEFGAAVTRAPHDEGALLGQAEALAAAGMRSDAAQVLDHVAEIQEVGGRMPEAADTLRRALELEEDPDRVRRQRALLREIRFSAGDRAAEQLLARALRLRDEPADGLVVATGPSAVMPGPVGPGPAPATPAPDAEPIESESPLTAELFPTEVSMQPETPEPIVASAEPGLVEPEPAPSFVQAPEPAIEESEPSVPEVEPLRAEPVAGLEPRDVRGRPAIGVMAGAESGAAPAGSGESGEAAVDGDQLLAEAEAAEAGGDRDRLRSLLLWAARAYAREGRFEASLDAAHRLLALSPNDVDAHLVLVDLYLARRWDGLAADKLRLLGKLAELNHDQETRLKLSQVASRAFPEDPTLASLLS
jgi:tetratricopeptide (TPR) repeat protein